MKLIISGSRTFENYDLIIDELAVHNFNADTVTEVVSGFARGPDRLGEMWAEARGIPIKRFPADWDKYGKAASLIRNSEMVEYADTCIVFWHGASKGTKYMIDRAKRKSGMRLVIVTVNDINYVKEIK